MKWRICNAASWKVRPMGKLTSYLEDGGTCVAGEHLEHPGLSTVLLEEPPCMAVLSSWNNNTNKFWLCDCLFQDFSNSYGSIWKIFSKIMQIST